MWVCLVKAVLFRLIRVLRVVVPANSTNVAFFVAFCRLLFMCGDAGPPSIDFDRNTNELSLRPLRCIASQHTHREREIEAEYCCHVERRPVQHRTTLFRGPTKQQPHQQPPAHPRSHSQGELVVGRCSGRSQYCVQVRQEDVRVLSTIMFLVVLVCCVAIALFAVWCVWLHWLAAERHFVCK